MGIRAAAVLWICLAACGAKTGVREPPGWDPGTFDGGGPPDRREDGGRDRDAGAGLDGDIGSGIGDGGGIDGRLEWDAAGDGGALEVGPRRDGGSVDAGPSCILPLEVRARTPDVVFVLDRSGSMRRSFGIRPPASRWQVLVTSLISPSTGVIPPREDLIRFGVFIYPTCETCAELIRPELHNLAPIAELLEANFPGGESRTALALQAAGRDVTAGPNGLVFVSVTDGEPTCGSTRDYCRREVLNVVRELYRRGIRTIPVGVGEPTAWPHFQDVADVGSGRPLGTGSEFVRAADGDGFGAAMDGLVDRLSECNAGIPPALRGVACPTLYVDGVLAPCDAPDGFRRLGEDLYELVGASCDRIRASGGAARVEAVVPCP